MQKRTFALLGTVQGLAARLNWWSDGAAREEGFGRSRPALATAAEEHELQTRLALWRNT